VFYITDTGRCWDGERYSVRDKPMIEVKSEKREVKSEKLGEEQCPYPPI
jgi:hypothetical protein